MIRNENEYQEAARRLREERQRLTAHRKRLEETGLAADEVKRALDPLRSFHQQLAEEVESYDDSNEAKSANSETFTGSGVRWSRYASPWGSRSESSPNA